jgi:hypothetical protein
MMEVKIGPYNTKELATLYRVSYKTFRAWLVPHLEKVGKKNSKYYTAKQVRIIFELLGEPEGV